MENSSQNTPWTNHGRRTSQKVRQIDGVRTMLFPHNFALKIAFWFGLSFCQNVVASTLLKKKTARKNWISMQSRAHRQNHSRKQQRLLSDEFQDSSSISGQSSTISEQQSFSSDQSLESAPFDIWQQKKSKRLPMSSISNQKTIDNRVSKLWKSVVEITGSENEGEIAALFDSAFQSRKGKRIFSEMTQKDRKIGNLFCTSFRMESQSKRLLTRGTSASKRSEMHKKCLPTRYSRAVSSPLELHLSGRLIFRKMNSD